jgi:hypothetical protein
MATTNEMKVVRILEKAWLNTVVTDRWYYLEWLDPNVIWRGINFDRMDIMYMSIDEAKRNAEKIKNFISKK